MEHHNGRYTLYKEEYAELALNYCLLGARNSDLAKFFNVCEKTINNWKKECPSFLLAIKRGRELAWSKTARSLYDKANGYDYKERKEIYAADDEGRMILVKTEIYNKHQAPDTGAIAFYLKNQAKQFGWADKHEVDLSGQVNIIVDSDDKELG